MLMMNRADLVPLKDTHLTWVVYRKLMAQVLIILLICLLQDIPLMEINACARTQLEG